MGRSSSSRKRKRDAIDISNRRLRNFSHNPLSEIEDLRRFHPEKTDDSSYVTKTNYGRPARILPLDTRTVRGSGVKLYEPSAQKVFSFEHPQRVPVCVRRRHRKEVLFAKKKTGSGRKKQRPPRWTKLSKVRC